LNIAIFGAGAWGTALALTLAEGHSVRLWARDAAQAAAMAATRRNARYLAEAALPESIAVSADAAAVAAGAELALIVTPVAGLRQTLALLPPSLPLLWACKGFETGTCKLPHQVVAETRGDVPCGALSGPSFALEVARGLPTALTLASRDAAFAQAMARELHQRTLRVYYSDDLAGVEIGGAVKNVMAIATGISDGLGLGMNARAALITRGLAELTRLGVRLGGRPETFMGLAGAGDLILTCTGDLSRNRRTGQMLAAGKKLDDILRELGHVAEGVHTARELETFAAGLGVDMPITRAVCGVLFRGVSPREAVGQLLSRDPRSEV
jgi:glycerol-3-phosphate dehydrogenase (NAD(P)+)